MSSNIYVGPVLICTPQDQWKEEFYYRICLTCNPQYSAEFIRDVKECNNSHPFCSKCGSRYCDFKYKETGKTDAYQVIELTNENLTVISSDNETHFVVPNKRNDFFFHENDHVSIIIDDNRIKENITFFKTNFGQYITIVQNIYGEKNCKIAYMAKSIIYQ